MLTYLIRTGFQSTCTRTFLRTINHTHVSYHIRIVARFLVFFIPDCWSITYIHS